MPQREVKLSLDISALRKSLGLTEAQLPDDATDEQINEVLANQPSGNPDAPAATLPADVPVAPTPQEPNEGGNTPPSGQTPPAQASAAPRQLPGGVMIDAEMWRQTQEELSVVRADREKREKQEDQEYLTKAVRAGKIPPARVDHYMSLMQADREGTREFIDGLPESLPMQREYGGMGELDDALKASDYPEQWLAPGERRRVKAAQAAYAEGRIGDVEPGAIIREA